MYDLQMGRFASRDPHASTVEPNPYEYARDSPMQRVDPFGNLSLRIGPPRYYGCGRAAWIAEFQLGPGEIDGYIIQKVTTRFKIVACREQGEKTSYRASAKCPTFETNTPSDIGELVYWEVWPIRNGVAYAHNPQFNTWDRIPAKDLFQSVGLDTVETWGSYYQHAEAAFFPGNVAPAADWRQDPTKPPHLLLFSCRAPGGWHKAKKQTSRTLYFSWNCCCDEHLEPRTKDSILPEKTPSTPVGRGWYKVAGLAGPVGTEKQ